MIIEHDDMIKPVSVFISFVHLKINYMYEHNIWFWFLGQCQATQRDCITKSHPATPNDTGLRVQRQEEGQETGISTPKCKHQQKKRKEIKTCDW